LSAVFTGKQTLNQMMRSCTDHHFIGRRLPLDARGQVGRLAQG
jgi:hypothetical protein